MCGLTQNGLIAKTQLGRKRASYARGMAKNKKYGLFSFLFDVVLTLITGGLWLIWIFVREMRRR